MFYIILNEYSRNIQSYLYDYQLMTFNGEKYFSYDFVIWKQEIISNKN